MYTCYKINTLLCEISQFNIHIYTSAFDILVCGKYFHLKDIHQNNILFKIFKIFLLYIEYIIYLNIFEL